MTTENKDNTQEASSLQPLGSRTEKTPRTDDGAGGERVEMTNEEKARWMAMGYKTKVAAQKMSRELADWNLMKLTFGFFQWKQKAKPTDEQLYFFEQGYRHDKAAGGGGEKRRAKKGSSATAKLTGGTSQPPDLAQTASVPSCAAQSGAGGEREETTL